MYAVMQPFSFSMLVKQAALGNRTSRWQKRDRYLDPENTSSHPQKKKLYRELVVLRDYFAIPILLKERVQAHEVI